MTDISSTDWTPQDEGNISASPNGSQGGFAPNTIPPTIRAIRGAVKRAHNKINAILTTTGTATALVLTHTVAPASLVKGERYAFFASQTNTGAMTLAVNNLGAKSILQQDGTALKAGQVVAGTATCVVWDGTAFRLENYVSNPKFSGTLTADALTVPTINGTTITGTLSGNGAAITALNGSNITIGTIDDARLPATMAGKTFSTQVTANSGVNITGALNVSGAFTANGTATVGGSRVLTMEDFGAGNGLDADKLDGQDGSYYLNRANQNGDIPLANVTNLQGSLNAKLNLTGGTITGGLVVNGGMSSAGDISVNKSNPALTLHYPGVRQGQMLVDASGTLVWRDQGSGDIKMYITDGGAIWTKELGSINGRIEGRALAWANDRVANLSSRLVSRGTSGATLDFEGPGGTVVTGYQREGGGAGQVRFVYYRYLQMFDPVRGWIGTTYA
ncbi:hypothetical protein RMR21_009605 [Agrobacterium sp. rho-8.1]|nr:hypothetical protein [Agrobacterium sp. rho-8.1]